MQAVWSSIVKMYGAHVKQKLNFSHCFYFHKILLSICWLFSLLILGFAIIHFKILISNNDNEITCRGCFIAVILNKILNCHWKPTFDEESTAGLWICIICFRNITFLDKCVQYNLAWKFFKVIFPFLISLYVFNMLCSFS